MNRHVYFACFVAASVFLLAGTRNPASAQEEIRTLSEHELLSKISVTVRNLDGKADRLPDIAAELRVIRQQLDHLIGSTWEYKLLRLNLFGDFERRVESLGQEGWELVAVTREEGFIFKRRLPKPR